MSEIIQTGRFWLMVWDVVISLVLYFVVKYAAPDLATDVKFVIGALQLPIVTLIAAYTHENVAELTAPK
jgi:predicted membrane protein